MRRHATHRCRRPAAGHGRLSAFLRRIVTQGVCPKMVAPLFASAMPGVSTDRDTVRALVGAVLRAPTAALREAVLDKNHDIDPRGLAPALARAIVRHGGTVAHGTQVGSVRVTAGRAVGVDATRDGAPLGLDAPTVVLAAGAWSSDAVASPLAPLRVRPVRRQMLRLRGPPLLRHVVRTAHTYLVPAAGGELWVGATLERAGFSGAATAGGVSELLRHGARALPGLSELQLVGCAVGVRPAVCDLQPVIGGAPDTAGLYVATGHYRDGVLLCAASAQLLADVILGAPPAPLLRPFGGERLLQEGAPVPGAPRTAPTVLTELRQNS